MKKLSMLLAVAALVAGVSANAADVASTGAGVGVLNDTFDGACGALAMNSDGGYENGYAWQFGGTVAPYYGAFAECYATPNLKACSVVLDLTQIGYDVGQTLDAYAWADAGGAPGAVINVAVGADPGAIAFWPSLSRHVINLPDDSDCVDATWTGYWGNWPGAQSGWFIGADTNGFGGCPYSNIAPGIGYPTGWNNVSVVWGPTQALGIGGEFVSCEPSPTVEATWGQIKNLYK
jgi:hypothetical protein